MVLVMTLAEGLGFYYDKNGNAAVGEVGGYDMLITNADKGSLYYLNISVTKGEKPTKADFEGIKEYNKYLKTIGVNKKNYRVVFTLGGAFTKDGTVKRFQEILSALARFLQDRGFQNCSEISGVTQGVSTYFAQGVKIITKSEYAEIERGIQEKQDKIALRGSSSILLGTVGALLGAVVAGAVVLCISQLGYVSWFGGVVMGGLVMGGYKVFAGRIQKIGIIISAIIMLAAMYLINRLDWALMIQRYFTPDMFGMEGTKLSLSFTFKNVVAIVETANLQADYFKNLGLQLLFTFICGLVTSIGVVQWDKNSFLAYPIGEEKQDVQDAGLPYTDNFGESEE